MKVSRIDVLTAVALAVVLVAGAAPAAEREPLAAVASNGDHMSWSTYSAAPQMALKVSGPGNTNFSERFENGNAPIFGLFDADGNSRPDGVYTWELIEEFGGVNDNVRDEANGRNTDRHTQARRVVTEGRRQAGAFTVKGGAIIDASIHEVKADRPSAN